MQRTSSSWSDPRPCALNIPRSTTWGTGQEVHAACIRTLSIVACPWKITFPSRLLTVRLLFKRFHSSWLSCQVPYSWRIWWCVWKVQNRSPVLSALTGPALPGSGPRTSPSDGPASTIASASTQMHTGNIELLFQLVLSWLEQEAWETHSSPAKGKPAVLTLPRWAERWVTVTAVYFTQICIQHRGGSGSNKIMLIWNH